jgi:hypothetical protein
MREPATGRMTGAMAQSSRFPIQRRLAIAAGDQTDIWRQWITRFASTNDLLTEAIGDDAVRISVIGQADDEEDAGKTTIAWDNAHRRTIIDILINTDDAFPAASRQETLQHELYLHALPAIIRHYNALAMGGTPAYLGPDEEGFEAEEESEHSSRDGWLEMLRNAVVTNNDDLRDRVLIDCQSHGNDVAALLQAARNVRIINEQTYRSLLEDFTAEDDDEAVDS